MSSSCVSLPDHCLFIFFVNMALLRMLHLTFVLDCSEQTIVCRPWLNLKTSEISTISLNRNYIIDPPHDKTNNAVVRQAKIQFSLGIRPVWSESSLCVQWVAKDPSFLNADSDDSDQTGRMPRLIWVLVGRTCHFVGFVTRRLIYIDTNI